MRVNSLPLINQQPAIGAPDGNLAGYHLLPPYDLKPGS
jgi:hypothetical protein